MNILMMAAPGSADVLFGFVGGMLTALLIAIVTYIIVLLRGKDDDENQH